MSLSVFYNTYHSQNRNKTYHKIIEDGNFTYFHTLKCLKKIEEILQKKQLAVLDVGCGVGTIDLYLAKKGHLVTGIDISSDAINIANQAKSANNIKSAEFIVGDVEKLNSKSKYDLIICSEVIEHVKDDVRLLKKLESLLDARGVLLITTPSVNAPLYRLGFLTDFDQRVGHLRRYTIPDLQNKVQKSGLQVIFSDKNESILRNSLYTFKSVGYLIKGLRGPLVPVFHWIDQLLVQAFGESDLVVIAQKK